MTALPKRRWRVYVRPSSSDSDVVADAFSTLSSYLPAIRFDDVTKPARFHCHTKIATRYRSGRILLAGDAAHVCSPAQGHGMNSGLQDAFNLAWKLALVCQGRCAPAILDSYEAERRPAAETILASGDAVEHVHIVTGKAERRARDEKIRAMFADTKLRHHETVADAELDIDYSSSPIVMGDKHEALAPGHRLPDTIDCLADGKACKLHEHAHRAGHTALIIGGPSVPVDKLAQLDRSVRALPHSRSPSGGGDGGGAPIIEATVAITTRSNDHHACARLQPAAAKQLGIDEITLLLIRPDGHVGLRADRNHLEALAAYHALLMSGRA